MQLYLAPMLGSEWKRKRVIINITHMDISCYSKKGILMEVISKLKDICL